MRPFLLIAAALALLAACGRPEAVPRAAAVTITDFDHETVFPLKTGEHHRNVDCNSCHGAFDTFTRYDCLGCHLAPDVDPKHEGVAGYVYESPACYACHPTGDCPNRGPGEHCDHANAGTLAP